MGMGCMEDGEERRVGAKGIVRREQESDGSGEEGSGMGQEKLMWKWQKGEG